MDVTLPNGVVLQGIPDGTPKHQIAMKAIKNGLATNKDFGYDEVKQEKATFLEGIGSGMQNTYRQATNILGADNDEAIADQASIDEGLGGWGQAGKITGELLATAPIGGGVSAAGKGLGRAVLAARRTGSVGKTPARALANTLNSRLGRGAVEGAGYGALYAGPDRRGEGAALGAGISGGLGALGRVAGAAGRRFKLTDITDEAKAVQELTGHHIPLSQSAEPGTVKMVYNALLANLPGVGGKYRDKYKTALQDFRNYAATRALPDDALNRYVDIPPSASMGQIFEKLGKFWDNAYEPLNRTKIGIYKTRIPTPPDWLAGLVSKVSRGNAKLPTPGVVEAREVRDLQKVIMDIRSRETNHSVKKQLQEYYDGLESMMKKGMPTNQKGRDTWKAYENLREPYRNYVSLQAAAHKASGSEFSGKQLETAARRGMNTNLREGEQSVLQKAGEQGAKALEDFPSKQGLFQTAAALGLVGGAMTGTALPVAATLAGAAGIGKVMTTEGFEKLISGQSKYLQQHARKLKAAGYGLREIATILGVEEDAT